VPGTGIVDAFADRDVWESRTSCSDVPSDAVFMGSVASPVIALLRLSLSLSVQCLIARTAPAAAAAGDTDDDDDNDDGDACNRPMDAIIETLTTDKFKSAHQGGAADHAENMTVQRVRGFLKQNTSNIAMSSRETQILKLILNSNRSSLVKSEYADGCCHLLNHKVGYLFFVSRKQNARFG